MRCEGAEYLLGNQRGELEKLKSSQYQKFASGLETENSAYSFSVPVDMKKDKTLPTFPTPPRGLTKDAAANFKLYKHYSIPSRSCTM